MQTSEKFYQWSNKISVYHLLLCLVCQLMSIDVKLQFPLQIKFNSFWTKFAPKKLLPVQSKTNEHSHQIQHIPIKLGTKFHFKHTVLIFWTKFVQKEYLQSKTEKSEHHHQIQHIRINLKTKFHLKQTILISWIKFA